MVEAMTGAVPLTEGVALAKLAAATVGARLVGHDLEPRIPVNQPSWSEPGASFVTLERRGQLRGCVGTLEAMRPLYKDVVRNAIRAMSDPRLPPVTADDWPELDVTVSVLTTPEPLLIPDRAALEAVLRPGVDGLILTDGQRRSTFLPAVWAKLPQPERFVAALLRKGGWPDTGWSADIIARRYTSSEYEDPAPRAVLVI
jgi:AmmeMemoRadiSam system protein A